MEEEALHFKKYPDIEVKMDHTHSGEVGWWEISEKLDGSNFRMQVLEDKIVCGSRRETLNFADAMGQFGIAMSAIRANESAIKDLAGFFFFGENFGKLKHNKMTYGRLPKDGIAWYEVFDMKTMTWLTHETGKYTALNRLAELVGEVNTPDCVLDHFPTPEEIEQWLAHPSRLGGGKREGVVIKAADIPGRDRYGHSPLYCKVVNKEFSEMMTQRLPKGPNDDPITDFIKTLLTDMRVQKAITRLEDEGRWAGDRETFVGANKMIGPMIQELTGDVLKEHSDELLAVAMKLVKKKLGTTVSAHVQKLVLGDKAACE